MTNDPLIEVRRTLDEVKAFLAQETPLRLSEADTKVHFVEPVLRALGWVGIEVLTREYYVPNSQQFIDYVLRGPSSLLMAIETKRLQEDLTDKHAAQLVQYCSIEGIEWAALMNGRELQFSNTFLTRDLAAKRVMRLDLLAFNTDEEFAGIFAQLWQLSREKMTAPPGIRDWMHRRRIDAWLRQTLVNPGSPMMANMRASLKDADIPATEQDIVAWFRATLSRPTGIVEIGGGPPPKLIHGVPDPTLPGKPGGRGNPHPTPSDAECGRLWPLIEADLLPVGTRLVLPRETQPPIEATVDGAGRIVFDGKPIRSPSDRTSPASWTGSR